MKKQIAKTVSNSSIRPILKCGPRDRQEKTLKTKLELNIKDPRNFVLSQWSNNPTPYIIYRSIAAILILAATIYLCIADKKRVKILIYLTYWSFFTLCFCVILQALSCWYYFGLHVIDDAESFATGHWRFALKLQWVLYYISTVAAPVVSLLYWTMRATDIYFENFTTHAATVIYILIDMAITRIPVRLYHCYITVAYGLMYGIFNIVYWASGGTNHKDQHWIYKQIDFDNNPGVAAGYISVMCLIAVPVSHIFMWMFYRIRMHVFHKYKICERTGVCSRTQAGDDYIPEENAVGDDGHVIDNIRI